MADIEPEFDVEKDLPEFLLSVLDWTEECIHNSEADINDLQAQSVVLDRTISLLSSIALTDIEQDRIEWESLAVAFAEVLRAIENHLKTLAVRPSSISRRKCEILRTGNPGRPQFYISPETLEGNRGQRTNGSIENYRLCLQVIDIRFTVMYTLLCPIEH